MYFYLVRDPCVKESVNEISTLLDDPARIDGDQVMEPELVVFLHSRTHHSE